MKRTIRDSEHDNSDQHSDRIKLELKFIKLAENFIKGIIGSEEDLLVYDPLEEPNDSFGIDYNLYFWEIFGAIEDPDIKACIWEKESRSYIKRLCSRMCYSTQISRYNYREKKQMNFTKFIAVKPEFTDEQVQELIDAFECYIDIIKYMTEAKV